jgi:hypothetical protein
LAEAVELWLEAASAKEIRRRFSALTTRISGRLIIYRPRLREDQGFMMAR